MPRLERSLLANVTGIHFFFFFTKRQFNTISHFAQPLTLELYYIQTQIVVILSFDYVSQ